jgi:hypothetical protein
LSAVTHTFPKFGMGQNMTLMTTTSSRCAFTTGMLRSVHPEEVSTPGRGYPARSVRKAYEPPDTPYDFSRSKLTKRPHASYARSTMPSFTLSASSSAPAFPQSCAAGAEAWASMPGPTARMSSSQTIRLPVTPPSLPLRSTM